MVFASTCRSYVLYRIRESGTIDASREFHVPFAYAHKTYEVDDARPPHPPLV